MDKEQLERIDNDIYLSKMKIVESSNKNPAILGTLEGPLMEMEKVNNNGRFYTRKLIEKRIVNSDYTKSMLENKTLFGETHHPDEVRLETWCDRVSHNLTKMWIDDKTNLLMGTIDVLDTFYGKCIWTLVEYGSILGISARAGGKLEKTRNGVEPVESSYIFRGFDFVTNPGFTSSRLHIKESFNETKNNIEEGSMENTLTSQTDSIIQNDKNNILGIQESENVTELLYTKLATIILESSDIDELNQAKTISEYVGSDKFMSLAETASLAIQNKEKEMTEKEELMDTYKNILNNLSKLTVQGTTAVQESVQPNVLENSVITNTGGVWSNVPNSQYVTPVSTYSTQPIVNVTDRLSESMDLKIKGYESTIENLQAIIENYDLKKADEILEAQEQCKLETDKAISEIEEKYKNDSLASDNKIEESNSIYESKIEENNLYIDDLRDTVDELISEQAELISENSGNKREMDAIVRESRELRARNKILTDKIADLKTLCISNGAKLEGSNTGNVQGLRESLKEKDEAYKKLSDFADMLAEALEEKENEIQESRSRQVDESYYSRYKGSVNESNENIGNFSYSNPYKRKPERFSTIVESVQKVDDISSNKNGNVNSKLLRMFKNIS